MLINPQTMLTRSILSFILSIATGRHFITTVFTIKTESQGLALPPGPDIAESREAWHHAIREILSSSKPFKSTGRHSSPWSWSGSSVSSMQNSWVPAHLTRPLTHFEILPRFIISTFPASTIDENLTQLPLLPYGLASTGTAPLVLPFW